MFDMHGEMHNLRWWILSFKHEELGETINVILLPVRDEPDVV